MAHHHTYTSRARVAWLPIYPAIAQFPIVCFTLTLLTDITYWVTENLMWLNFSSWLLLAGAVMAVVTAVCFALEYFLGTVRLDWWTAIGSSIVFVLAILNSLVHAGDGWTAVVPWGLAFSVATVAAILITGVIRSHSAPAVMSGASPHD